MGIMETSLLKNKNFILLYLGRLVSNFGNIFYNFAIGWFILSLTQSPAQAAAYMAFGAIIFFVLTPFGGVLSDRWDRVKIVYITDFIRGTSIVLAGLVIMYNGVITIGSLSIDFGSDVFKIVDLYITAFIISVNGALFNPAVTTLTPYIVGKEQLQKANASLHAQNALINIAGTVTAAALYASLGIGWIFIINGVAYIGSAISEIFINVKTKENVESQLTVKQMFVDMGQGLGYLFKNRGLFVFTIVAVIINFFLAPVYSIGLPYLYNQVLRTEPIYYSLIGVLASIGTIVMSIIFTLIKQRDRMYKFITWGTLAWIPLLIIQALLIYLVVSGVIGFWLFFGISIGIAFLDGNISVFVNTPIGVAFQKYVPREMLGRVNSMLNTLVQGLVPISIALGGVFLEYRSVAELYLIGVVGFIIGATVFYCSKSVKQL
jgi:MFS family permease